MLKRRAALLPLTITRLPERMAHLSAGEWAMLLPFGVFCFVYPFALLLLSFDWMPFGMEWMSSLLLAMLGLAAWTWLRLNFSLVGAALGALIFAAGVALEYIGVSSGLPFGHYRYTGVLVPGLPGGVPLAIGFAWLFICISSLFTAATLRRFPGNPPRRLLLVTVGALLATGLDLLLEPVAYRVKGYWQWLEPTAPYYGVPWSNFAAWFAAALLLNALVISLLSPTSTATRYPWLPSALYTMNIALFAVVALAHALWLPALIGLFLLLALWALARPSPR
ncbi:MAG: carotenoid biosynthesis protein [Chloroflexia bacterium]